MREFLGTTRHDQHTDPTRQRARLRVHTKAAGRKVAWKVKEIGSGLDGHRQKLSALLQVGDQRGKLASGYAF